MKKKDKLSLFVILPIGIIGIGLLVLFLLPDKDPNRSTALIQNPVKTEERGGSEPEAPPLPDNPAAATSDDETSFVAHLQTLLTGTWQESEGGVIGFDGQSTVTEMGFLANPNSPSLFLESGYRQGLVTYKFHGTSESPAILITNASSSTATPKVSKLRIVSIKDDTMTVIWTHLPNPEEFKVEYEKISDNPRHFYPQSTTD